MPKPTAAQLEKADVYADEKKQQLVEQAAATLSKEFRAAVKTWIKNARQFFPEKQRSRWSLGHIRANNAPVRKSTEDLAQQLGTLYMQIARQARRLAYARAYATAKATQGKLFGVTPDPHVALPKLKESESFNPDQPRVPAGDPSGGQWGSGGTTTRDALDAGKSERLRGRLAAIESSIATKTDHEVAHILDSGGYTRFDQHGEKSRVRFTADQVRAMGGAILTHNHPSGNSLSLADVALASDANLQEIRAIGTVNGEQRLYVMQRPGGGWSHASDVVKAFEEMNSAVHTEFTSRIDANKMTVEQATTEHYHEVWTRLTRENPSIGVYHAVRGGS